MTIYERFWSKVEKSDDCWTWRGGKGDKGYGVVSLFGKDFRAHRMAYLLEVGGIPHGLCVCHACDNPSCVRPDHLFLGTHADNMQDARAKGRLRGGHGGGPGGHIGHGENNPHHRLTLADVERIRALLASGPINMAALARSYGVHPQTIYQIAWGKSWTYGNGE